MLSEFLQGKNVNCSNVRIKGFIRLSMLDWPGKMCSVIFLGGCNFRCPACHNHELVTNPDDLPDYSLNDIVSYLSCRSGWIDGVTITGGEPTVNPFLDNLLSVILGMGFRTKLDTNGSNPALLERLISSGLVSAVSMDIKSSLESDSYSTVAGTRIDPGKIKHSIKVIRNSGIEHFFRTTVVPGLVEESDLQNIKRLIGEDSPYIIQPFRNAKTLNPEFSEIPEYSLARFEAMRASFENRNFH